MAPLSAPQDALLAPCWCRTDVMSRNDNACTSEADLKSSSSLLVLFKLAQSSVANTFA